MNLVLLSSGDFETGGTAIVRGRRARHILDVHRVSVGDTLVAGLIGNKIGSAVVARLEKEEIELAVDLDSDPPPPLPLTLVMALPRPKVLNRVVASATSLGIKAIYFLNAWRVEKSYWKSPRLSEENLTRQAVLGLEQAKDTIMPRIFLERFFRAFVEERLPELAEGSRRLVAHPRSATEAPRAVKERTTLIIGPEGGFIEQELDTLSTLGFTSVSLGPRILRSETALPVLIGRLF